MALIDDRGLIADRWTMLDGDAPVPAGAGAVCVPLTRWQHDRAALIATGCLLGVRLASDEDCIVLGADVARLGLVALEFAKFTDGRPYSQARILRQRLGYAGELRALGNVLRDQIFFMRRCGFDSFALPDTADAAGWLAAFGDFSVAYQPAADAVVPIHGLRRSAARMPTTDAA